MLGLRKLTLADMDAAAAVHRASFNHALPKLAGLHTPDEDRAFYRTQMFPACQVWGAEKQSKLVGIIAFREGWIDQLYVLPDAQGRGVGSDLLEVAQTTFPVLNLWTFQCNVRARHFYELNGFTTVRQTDGSDNEEKEPDVLYRWERG
jgi:ribosomal protein S18 acetylase RimI-like enzyme